MPRKANIAFDGKKLDQDIKKLEGSRYSQAKISEIIMGNGSTYFSNAINRELISEESLKKVCSFYNLNIADYIITEKDKKEAMKKEVDSTNFENILVHLAAINKLMAELLAQQKSTNYMLGQMTDKIQMIQKSSKEINDKVDSSQNRSRSYNDRSGIRKMN